MLSLTRNMLLRTVTLLCITVLQTAQSDTTQVISGVFLTSSDLYLNYSSAVTACEDSKASLATLAQVTNAYSNGYEFCKWGWVAEHNIVMLRLTPAENCGNYSVGILVRACRSLEARGVFCFRTNGTSRSLYSVEYSTSVYEDASAQCSVNGDRIATQEQIEATTNRSVTYNSAAWFDWGVGVILQNGTFTVSPCQDTRGNVSAFCYNSALPDVLIAKDDKTWKIIVISCIIGSIFIVLLIAAFFMKGNQFICCIDEKHPGAFPGSIHSQVPSWNTTSTYRPRILSIDPKYISTSGIEIEKRPPVIHPDMSKYKSHFYSNIGYDNTGDQ